MSRSNPERYWLIHPNGGRQLIDPSQFDLTSLAERARLVGGQLVVEGGATAPAPRTSESDGRAWPGPERVAPVERPPLRFEPPISALTPMFRHRIDRIYRVMVEYDLEINTRPTTRVLGGYYKTRRLVRVYSHDRQIGRRPLEELFDTFLHEMAHHIEYTEPDSYHARECGRVPGRMHSRLFWRILGDLKARWFELQRQG
ncbi:MAG: hypothetical protein U0794_06360 [Isosphaeraceae bacterium]